MGDVADVANDDESWYHAAILVCLIVSRCTLHAMYVTISKQYTANTE